MLTAPGREEPGLAAAGSTALHVSVRCSSVDLHWLILRQAQIAINVLLMLSKLVIFYFRHDCALLASP